LPAVWRVFRWWFSPELVIGLFPGWFAKPPADWPAQIRLAGFGRYDGAHADLDGELPDDLRAFCAAGAPPIAFTLGTGMAHGDEFFRMAVAACEEGGWRGVLLTKFRDLAPQSLPSQVIHCEFAPFRRLLPLCGAVVHHGGVGTTAAALEAGCPQLILPLAWDQPDNAARVEKLGVGESLSSRRRTVAGLRAALERITAPLFSDRCRTVASLAAADADGLEVAADLVEQLGAGRGGGSKSRC
jgi:UDP:flavonoid glycosyltransferase YjiC (YdhE family)